MKFRHKLSGDDALSASLKRLSASVRHDVLVDALLEAAEPIRAEAANLAPRGPGHGPHLADEIVAAETSFVSSRGSDRAVEAGEAVVAIGPAFRPHDVFYGLFQEFGTVKHPAQPFLRPAFDSRIGAARKILAAALWRAVSTSVKKTSVQSPGRGL